MSPAESLPILTIRNSLPIFTLLVLEQRVPDLGSSNGGADDRSAAKRRKTNDNEDYTVDEESKRSRMAVLKQFGGGGYDSDNVLAGEADLQQHQKLEKLYISTRAAKMPVMDGYEATRRIREEEEKHGVHIPIIALTAHTADEQGSRITEAGMDYHLTKPCPKKNFLMP